MPSGSVIFACFSVSSDSRSASKTTTPLQQSEYDVSSYMTQGPQYYPSSTSYGLPSMSSPYDSSHGAPTSSQPNPPQISSPYASQPGWSSAIDPSPPLQYNWSSTGAHASTPAYRTNAQHLRQHSYHFQQSSHWTSAAFPETDSPLPPSYHPLSPDTPTPLQIIIKHLFQVQWRQFHHLAILAVLPLREVYGSILRVAALPLEILLWGYRAVRAAKLRQARNGGRDLVGRRISVMSMYFAFAC